MKGAPMKLTTMSQSFLAEPPLSSALAEAETSALRLATLIRLRWLAVVGQLAATLTAVFALGFQLPLAAALSCVAASATLNLALTRAFPASTRLRPTAATALLAYDLAQLAALLHLTGGLQNPFSLLFLAPVAVSATTLPPRHSVGLGLAMAALAALLVEFRAPMPWFFGATLELQPLHQWSIWLALAIGAAFIGVYAGRVAHEARQLSDALAATDLALARQAHLSQLDGVAAAAAHELGTPLGTIRLVTREWMRGDTPQSEDIELVSQEADRCRSILTRLSSLRSDPILQRLSLGQLIEEAVAPHRHGEVEADVDMSGVGPEPIVARNPALTYGLGNLVENAFDFAAGAVRIEASWNAETLAIVVTDDGPGFSPSVLKQIGDPYLRSSRDGRRTKDEGGLGLGLFIAKTLLERTGARLTFGNAPEGGARARLTWRREALEATGDPLAG
jgi:two-component system sensor histidine kinase RegB